MPLFTFTACAILFLTIPDVNCAVTVEDGGYSNVVVSFKHAIPTENGKKLLDELMTQLQETSEILHNAIGLHISKVTVNIPRNWDASEWDLTVEKSDAILRDDEADILVGNTSDTVFGTLPYTAQHGSCGVPGSQLMIPTNFLETNSDYPKGTFLAREWLKYRYGVFDENGYPGDVLYPEYYTIPGADPSDITVTGCSNSEIQYNFQGPDEGNCTDENLLKRECEAKPLEESIENVTSSLMYFHKDIPKMKHVCGKDDDHPHSSRSRNKHNAMCHGKSIWEVISSSDDFKNLVQSSEGGEIKPIEFTLIQEGYPKFVIAWENTKALKEQGPFIINAIKRFVFELPKGCKVSLFPYFDNKSKENPLRELKDWPNDWKFDDIASPFARPPPACTTCAIDKALNILAADNSNGVKSVIIISSTTVEIDKDLQKKIDDSKAHWQFLVFGSGNSVPDHKNIFNEPNTRNYIAIPKTDVKKSIFEFIFHVLESFLPPNVEDKVTETVQTELSRDGIMSFAVDSTVEKITFWVCHKTEDVEIKIDDKEVVDMDEVIISDISAFAYTITQPGLISFKFDYAMEEEYIVQARSTSKPGQYIDGRVWIHDTTKPGSSQQEPVILHVDVRFGAYPVQNAEVTAVIKRVQNPNEDKVPEEFEDLELQMFDDGADPDVTALDGVYSRYFISFIENGHYEVTITVKNQESTARGGKVEQEGLIPCCGHTAKAGNLEIPDFTKEFYTEFTSISGRPEQGYKPSRIVDLRVENVEDDKVTLTWTAPGGEADSGTVESYSIKYFTSEEEVKDLDKGKDFDFETTAQSRGSTEKIEVQLSDFDSNSVIYIAALSSNQNYTSDISNIVEVLVSESVEITTKGDNTVKKSGFNNKETIGLVVGIILGVIVICIILYLVVYFAVLKPKKRKELDKAAAAENPRRDQASQEGHDNHAMNPVSFVSADTLIKHHNEKTRAKMENKEAPILEEKDFERNDSAAQMRENSNERPGYSRANENPSLQQAAPKSPKRTTPV